VEAKPGWLSSPCEQPRVGGQIVVYIFPDVEGAGSE
jgi:hypothetical protein